MRWIVELLDARVGAELEALPLDMKARFARIVGLIQDHGLERVREPHVKHLQAGYGRCGYKGKDGISRAVYVTASGRRVVVVRIFIKKTQKTPKQELAIALERAREVKE